MFQKKKFKKFYILALYLKLRVLFINISLVQVVLGLDPLSEVLDLTFVDRKKWLRKETPLKNISSKQRLIIEKSSKYFVLKKEKKSWGCYLHSYSYSHRDIILFLNRNTDCCWLLVQSQGVLDWDCGSYLLNLVLMTNGSQSQPGFFPNFNSALVVTCFSLIVWTFVLVNRTCEVIKKKMNEKKKERR